MLILVLIILAALGAYFSFLRDSQRRKGLTSEVLANVTNTEVRRSTDPESGKESSADINVSSNMKLTDGNTCGKSE